MKTHPIGKVFFLLCFVLVIPAMGHGAGIRATAELDRRTATLGETFYLTVGVEVDGDQRLSVLPDIPKVDGLVVQRPQQQGPTFVTINNRSYVDYKFHYPIYAQKVGEHRIDGIAIRQGGEIFRANSVSIKVTEADSNSTLNPSLAVQAVAGLDKTEIYRGEQVILNIDVYSQAQVTQSPGFESLESFEGFFMQRIQVPWRQYPTTVGGKRYYKGEAPIRFALFPLGTGELTIPPITLQVVVPEGGSRGTGPFNDPFFPDPFSLFSRGKVVSVTTKPMTLNVKPFPEGGQPEGFFGAVGKMNLSAEAQPRQVKVGQAVTLTVTLSGEANFSQVNSPIWPDFTGFAPNENNPQTELRVENNRVVGQKTWEKILIVRKADVSRIGPVRLPYFDPEKKAYVDLSTEPIELIIDSSAGGGKEVVILNTGEEIEINQDDFRYIVTDAGVLTSQDGRLYGGPLFWALNLAPVFLVVSTTTYRRRQRRMESDEGYARRVRAPHQARKVLSEAKARMNTESRGEFFALLSKAILGLIEDRFGFSARGLIQEDVSVRLIRTGADRDLAKETSEFLLHVDNSRFAGGENDASLAMDYDKAKELIDRLLKT